MGNIFIEYITWHDGLPRFGLKDNDMAFNIDNLAFNIIHFYYLANFIILTNITHGQQMTDGMARPKTKSSVRSKSGFFQLPTRSAPAREWIGAASFRPPQG